METRLSVRSTNNISMIDVHNLKKTYLLGQIEVHALRGVSFEIKKGEFVACMGKSGSGKSTILRQLGLIDRPTAGRIIIDNKEVINMPDNERTRFRLNSLGFIFQEYALLPELTALENVILPGMMQGRKKFEYLTKGRKLLSTVGLKDRLHHRPKEMSGGEQQRVAIARSLINDPAILLADEPSANLDSLSSKIIIETFQHLNKTLGQTILMVTHDPDHIEAVDRVIWLKDGRISPRRTL